MAFSFVHTADIHLDSPLKSLALRDPDLAELIGSASRTAFRRIINLCLEEKVDALLIAGDLYDGAQTSMKTARFLAQELGRLHDAEIEAFIIRGNHDAESKITRELVLPDNVHLFSGRTGVEARQWNGQSVAIHGVSFRHKHAPDSLLSTYKPPVSGAFNIGMMHTSLGGTEGHDLYAPCSLSDLQDHGFDYWALGHIHQRSEFTNPTTTVVMPGIPQGRDIGEAGEKSVTLVKVDDLGKVTLNPRNVSVAQFERVEIECDGLEEWPVLVQNLRRALATERQNSPCEHLILRPRIVGDTPLAWRLKRDADLLLAEAQAASDAIGTLWVDKLEIDVTGGHSAPGALGELAALLDGELLDASDPAIVAELNQLQKNLPRDLRGFLGDTEADQHAALSDLIEAGASDVLARLVHDQGS